jgi:hypothetical protein
MRVKMMRNEILLAAFAFTLGVAGPGAACAADWAKNAASCPTIRLDDPGKSFHDMPIQDQNPYGICYAFSAAQMIDAWRYSHGRQPPEGGYGRMTSPFPIAARMSLQAGSLDSLTGGLISDALHDVQTHGSCDHKAVFQGTKGGPGSWEDKYISTLRTAYNKMTAFLKDKVTLRRLAAEADEQHAEVEEYVEFRHGAGPIGMDIVCMLEEADVPRQLSNQTMHILPLALVKGRSPIDFFDRFFGAMCKNNSIKPAIEGRVPSVVEDAYEPGEGWSQAKLMHERLLKPNPQPIGISYCAEILTTKDHSIAGVRHQGNELNCRADSANPKSIHTNHGSVVIGQRWNPETNKCQFLVRNSWGDGCAQYSWGPIKTADSNPPYPGCERGQIWVDEDALGRNTMATSYLK